MIDVSVTLYGLSRGVKSTPCDIPSGPLPCMDSLSRGVAVNSRYPSTLYDSGTVPEHIAHSHNVCHDTDPLMKSLLHDDKHFIKKQSENIS